LFFRQFGAKIRDHPVVAAQHAILGRNGLELSAAHVGNVYFFASACVLHVNDRAVQANTHRAASLIELGVIGPRGDDILHR